MLNALRFRFLPVNPDFALLLLRVTFGAGLLYLHGWGKLTGYPERMHRFADPFGIGSPVSLALSIFAEVVCSALIVLGLFTRFAALVCVINMTVAFTFAHQMRLWGERNGELAFAYLIVFLAIFIAGPGRYSMDGK
ncbi:MAG TPA: DoxX family protein [Vicinamibacterales bacterium]